MRMYPHIYVMQGEVCIPKRVNIRLLSKNHSNDQSARGESGGRRVPLSATVGADEDGLGDSGEAAVQGTRR